MTTSADRLAPYTPAQRSLARSLVHAHGTLTAARAHLAKLWSGDDQHPDSPDRVPTIAALTRWRDDPAIPIDTELVAQFQNAARAFVTGSAFRIAQSAEGSILAALAQNDPLAAHKYSQVWSAATDKLQPREAALSPFGGMKGMGPGTKFVATFAIEQPVADRQLVEERAS